MNPQPSSITVVLLGPQAAGKSTVASALAVELRRRGEKVALVELDQIAEMALPTLPSWETAAQIFGLVTGRWVRSGLSCVIAEGISSGEELSGLRAHLPETAAMITVAVTTSFGGALERAQADPTRGASKDPGFLAERYAEWAGELSRIEADLVLDTSAVSVRQGVGLIVEAIGSARASAC